MAAQWLADRGWGKAKEIIELTGDAPATPEQRLALLRRLSDDERATLRGLLAKALATPDVPGPSDSRAAGDLEPEDHPVDGQPPLEAGAPATLGRPRNVGRAIAQALELPDPLPGRAKAEPRRPAHGGARESRVAPRFGPRQAALPPAKEKRSRRRDNPLDRRAEEERR
jgi:hypothetical protein